MGETFAPGTAPAAVFIWDTVSEPPTISSNILNMLGTILTSIENREEGREGSGFQLGAEDGDTIPGWLKIDFQIYSPGDSATFLPWVYDTSFSTVLLNICEIRIIGILWSLDE